VSIIISTKEIAVTRLDGGRTAYSALKLPLNVQITERLTCNIKKKNKNEWVKCFKHVSYV
ncbi:ATP-dependent DNA helicase, partial [Aphis craccivora]